ncbi:hypothetical protein M405DRAFT_938802 [Rhizopogon salebrosus TDB-379]|nr:hypothetical protein M405DRAFT_938802 [Rhizopogon salebrosus TDB-379]
MSSSQDAPRRKPRKKALLIAVRKVKGIKVALPRTHHDAQELKELLINQYDYAEDDIIMLLDDRNLHPSFWPSAVNILKKINWLVEDAGEHDRLVFYYSGHGGQTTCRHNSEVDGKDEVIYGYNGLTIVDNALRRRLVDPVLKAKGCHLFALFDCCHSETILDLKHCNCCPPQMPSLVTPFIASSQTSGMDAIQIPVSNKWFWLSKDSRIALPVSITQQKKYVLHISQWSVIGLANRALGHLRNCITGMLNGFLKSMPSPVNVPVETTPVPLRQKISVDTSVTSRSNWLMSPTRAVMSPISIFPNGSCNSTCDMTKEEENQGRVVCLSACRDSELAHDDNETGGTLTKFFMNSLKKNFSISYRDLLEDIKFVFYDHFGSSYLTSFQVPGYRPPSKESKDAETMFWLVSSSKETARGQIRKRQHFNKKKGFYSGTSNYQ